MKSRKLAALAVSAALVVGVAGTALADHNTTVPGAVYSGDHGKGFSKDHGKIKDDLTKAGVKDVPETHWAAGSISVLVESGLLTPDTNGNVNPDSSVRKDEGIAVFAKVLGIASKTDDAATAAKKAKDAGIVSGDVSADRPMTRLEVAKLIATALGITPKASKVPFSDLEGLSSEDALLLGALYEAGVFKGFPDGTFQPGGVLTKSQIAILIDRILGGAGK